MAHAEATHIDKVVVNTGIGRLSSQAGFKDKILPGLMNEFASITGQKPSTRSAKKSISGFKLREGTVVGLTATLRGARRLAFIERLVRVVLPRVRDFRGIPLRAVDANGNLTIGMKESIVFPEVNLDSAKTSFGLQVTIVSKGAKDREAAIEFYRSLGIQFARDREKKHG